MRVALLYADDRHALTEDWPVGQQDVVRDLGLGRVFDVMADGDKYVWKASSATLLHGVAEPSDVAHRQSVLAGFLSSPDVPRSLYALSNAARKSKRDAIWGFLSDHPTSTLARSTSMLERLVGHLKELRRIVDTRRAAFSGVGLSRFAEMVEDELDDQYFALLAQQLRRLKFGGGVATTARLGAGGKGRDPVLRKTEHALFEWPDALKLGPRSEYSFRIPERDLAGSDALVRLKDIALNEAGNAVAQAAEHIVAFFDRLGWESAFYVGCVNLHEYLARSGKPVCFPTVDDSTANTAANTLSFGGLYDVGLATRIDEPLVGNSLAADGTTLLIVTGANQGGKSTLLRALGLASLMASAGMYVGADRFRAGLTHGVYTHFRREEDASMESGKLDEELARMAAITKLLRPGSLLLSNESLACTNEREGAAIAREVIDALRVRGVRVYLVTHMYGLSGGYARDGRENTTFLRAERLPDGARTFVLKPRDPQPTSYGADLYETIFGTALDPRAPLRQVPP
jgi:MutS domain V